MKNLRRHFLCAVAATLCASLTPLATAQSYPSKPVRLVVPFPAGGATDVFARVIAQKLGDHLGQPLVVENRPGAGGAIGSDQVAKAPADGYTLLLATSSTHAIGPSLNPKLPYQVADFTPIAHVGDAPSIVLVPNNSPAKTLAEWVAHAKANPGKLNYASSGNGTIVHLGTELLKAQAGLFLVHIPYRGTALAIPDLMSGKLDLLVDSLPTGLPHVREGRLRALAVTSAKRTPLAPELPAVAEVLPGYESNTWFGLYGPKGMDAAVVDRLGKALSLALGDADVKERLARLGIEPVGGNAADFARMVSADTAKWKKIIVDRKITLD